MKAIINEPSWVHNLIERGDRIVTAHPIDGLPDVSGIVAKSLYTGAGSLQLLIYEGVTQRKGGTQVEMSFYPADYLSLDVVETDCVVPKIPAAMNDAFEEAVRLAMDDYGKTKENSYEHRCVESMKGFIPKLAMPDVGIPDDARRAIKSIGADGLAIVLVEQCKQRLRQTKDSHAGLFLVATFDAIDKYAKEIYAEVTR